MQSWCQDHHKPLVVREAGEAEKPETQTGQPLGRRPYIALRQWEWWWKGERCKELSRDAIDFAEVAALGSGEQMPVKSPQADGVTCTNRNLWRERQKVEGRVLSWGVWGLARFYDYEAASDSGHSLTDAQNVDWDLNADSGGGCRERKCGGGRAEGGHQQRQKQEPSLFWWGPLSMVNAK